MDQLPPVTAAGATWSTIPFTPDYLFRLRSLISGQEALVKSGYILEPYSTEKILAQQRCQHCKKKLQKNYKEEFEVGVRVPNERENNVASNDEPSTPSRRRPRSRRKPSNDSQACVANSADSEPSETASSSDPPASEKPRRGRRPVCQYHPGIVTTKNISQPKNTPPRRVPVFTCCSRPLGSAGCTSSNTHTPIVYPPGALTALWTFHTTPPTATIWSLSMPKRVAVALDCEMGLSAFGENEIIRITLLDYFTGEVLIDSLVRPRIPILSYRSRFSGVTARDMDVAVETGRYLDGRESALQLVWSFVGQETLVIVHGGDNDLKDLRWIHGNIVDSVKFPWPGRTQPANGGLTGKAGGKRNLKDLAKEFLGREVQQGKGHCSLEDSFACRELVHWWVCWGDAVEAELEWRVAEEAAAMADA